jgi:hypothetical protein
MPLSLLIALRAGFVGKNPLYVEETALLSLLLIYKRANVAVMADLDYDVVNIFLFLCRPSLLKTADFFLWSGRCGLSVKAFSLFVGLDGSGKVSLLLDNN